MMLLFSLRGKTGGEFGSELGHVSRVLQILCQDSGHTAGIRRNLGQTGLVPVPVNPRATFKRANIKPGGKRRRLQPSLLKPHWQILAETTSL